MEAALNIASATLPGVMPGQLEFTPSAAGKVADLIVEEGNPPSQIAPVRHRRRLFGLLLRFCL